MGKFDFANAQLPRLYPLEQSHAQNEVEDELRRLTMRLWDDHLAEQAFDVNVSGMAHLGSFELVRRSVNQDGLALLPGGGEEPSTRYLYRAWKARNHQGRGLHFARTYLQMLFPNVSKVEQLYMPLEGQYPDDCLSIIPEEQFILPAIYDNNGLRLDGTWRLGEMIDTSKQGIDGSWSYNTDGLILTSRVLITLDFSVDASGVGNLMQILRAVMGAKFVPVFRYSITAESPFPIEVAVEIEAYIPVKAQVAHPDLLMVTDDPEWVWHLGADGDADAPRLMASRAKVFDGDDPQVAP